MQGRFAAGLMLFTILAAYSVSSAVEDMAPPLEHEHRLYRDENGRLFVAVDIPIYLFIGSDPEAKSGLNVLKSQKSQALTNPMFFAEGTNNIRNARAVDPETLKPLRDIEIGFEVYGDGTPPQTTATLTDAPEHSAKGVVYFGRDLVFNLKASDQLSGVQQTFVSVNGKEFKPFTEALADFVKDEWFVLRHYSVDNVGNTEIFKTTSFQVDVTPPRTVYTVTGVFNWDVLSSSADITLSSGDNLSGVAKIRYQIDDGSVMDYKKPIAVSGLSNGKHVLTYWARDNVQNIEDKHTYTFTFDNTPPSIISNVIGDQSHVESTIYVSSRSQVNLTASDEHAGLERITYSVGDEEPTLFSSPFRLPAVDGIHTVTYQCSDLVKNTSEKYMMKYYLDLTAPTTSHDFTGSVFTDFNTFIFDKNTRIILTSTDMESGVKETRYRINQGKEIKYDEPFAIEKDGDYLIEYYAIDNVTNVEEWKSVKVRIDNSPRLSARSVNPTLQAKQWVPLIAKGEPSRLASSNVIGGTEVPFFLRIAASPEDTATSWLLDMRTVSTEDSVPLWFDHKEENTLALSIDGRVSQSFKVFIDGTPPRTTVALSEAKRIVKGDDEIYGPGLTLTLKAADNIKGTRSGIKKIFYSVDGSDYVAYKEPLTSFYREKTYEYRFYAVDSVGNAEKPSKIVFIVDLTPPKSKNIIEGSFYGNTLSPGSAIVLTSSDNLAGVKRIYYSFDDQKFVEYTGKLSSRHFRGLPDGNHVLNFYAVDNVGNSEDARSFKFTLDKTAPDNEASTSGDIYESDGITYISTRSKISLGASDDQLSVRSLNYQIDGGDWQEFDEPFSIKGSDSLRIIQYYSVDIVGNKSKQRSKQVYLDRTPPSSTHEIEGPQFNLGENLVVNSSTSFVLQAEDTESGVKHILYKIDGGKTRTYSKPLRLSSTGEHRIEYWAIDNVNNWETKNKISFTVDVNPPEVHISYSINPTKDAESGVYLIPRKALVYLAATDAHSEVERIMYSVNGDKELLYRKPLTNFKKGQTVSLRVTAIDRLGNSQVKEVSLLIQ